MYRVYVFDLYIRNLWQQNQFRVVLKIIDYDFYCNKIQAPTPTTMTRRQALFKIQKHTVYVHTYMISVKASCTTEVGNKTIFVIDFLSH